jgi:hypothetical protein
VRSTLIKEAAVLGGDISAFVPPVVLEYLKKRIPSISPSGVGLDGGEPPATGRKGAGLKGEGIE